jgi:hypothetical protein
VQVAEISEQLDKYKKSVEKFGVSITTDGWDDNSGRHLHNFMVVTTEGPDFHSSVDTSDRDTVDAAYVAEGIIEILKDVGPKNGTSRMRCRATLRFLRLRMRWRQRVRTVRDSEDE